MIRMVAVWRGGKNTAKWVCTSRWLLLQSLLGPVWNQGNEDSHPGFGWCRENHHFVPAAGWGGGHHNPK